MLNFICLRRLYSFIWYITILKRVHVRILTGVANVGINFGLSIETSITTWNVSAVSGFTILDIFVWRETEKGSRSKKFRDLLGVDSLSAMAFCGYSKYVGGGCGASPERAATDWRLEQGYQGPSQNLRRLRICFEFGSKASAGPDSKVQN